MKRFKAFWDEEGGMGSRVLTQTEVPYLAHSNGTGDQRSAACNSLKEWAAIAEPGDEYEGDGTFATIIRIKDYVAS